MQGNDFLSFLSIVLLMNFYVQPFLPLLSDHYFAMYQANVLAFSLYLQNYVWDYKVMDYLE